MVALSLEEYSKLTDGMENAMDEADLAAESGSSAIRIMRFSRDLKGE